MWKAISGSCWILTPDQDLVLDDKRFSRWLFYNKHESEMLILLLIVPKLLEACQGEGALRGLRIPPVRVRAYPQRNRSNAESTAHCCPDVLTIGCWLGQAYSSNSPYIHLSLIFYKNVAPCRSLSRALAICADIPWSSSSFYPYTK